MDLKKIPKSPGIYQYLNQKGEIIYIGKSVNLFSRVHSYFNGRSKLNFAKQKMVDQIADIKTIVVENETESLILETNLIKKHLPKYNILMKDGKNYLYIKITNHRFPKILKTRMKNKSGKYYGPYISGTYVNTILKFIKKHFGYGCFGEHFFSDGKGYNLDKYLFKNNLSENYTLEGRQEAYKKQIDKIGKFLSGDYKSVISSLQEKMFQYAKDLQFEEAQKLKETIESLSSLEISQNMRDSVSGNYNIIHYLHKFDNHHIGVIQLRDGKIIDFQNFHVLNALDEEKEIIILSIIEQLIAEEEGKQKIKYILPFAIVLPEYLQSTSIELPKIGPKHDLLKMCYKNIYEFAYKKHLDSLSTKGFTKKTQQSLLELLSYQAINKDIIFECNDISHISGNHTVASRSIIENGKSNTSKYKKFRIKTLESQKIDDFGSMKEIMIRRLLEIEKSGILPDLIIIDGGKGQLGAVMQIINDYLASHNSPILGNNQDSVPSGKDLIKKLQLVSIAKREEELFLPGQSESILLKKDSLELRLVQKIRDEAHRFAITFNRDSRNKAMKKNILESLPGFGPVTRKKILKQFGSVDGLKNFSKETLLEYMNMTQYETLENHGLVK